MKSHVIFSSVALATVGGMLIVLAAIAGMEAGSWRPLGYGASLGAVLLVASAWVKLSGRAGVEVPDWIIGAAFVAAGLVSAYVQWFRFPVEVRGFAFPAFLILVGLAIPIGSRLRGRPWQGQRK